MNKGIRNNYKIFLLNISWGFCIFTDEKRDELMGDLNVLSSDNEFDCFLITFIPV